MAQIHLTCDEIEAVETLVARATSAQQLRRALAILWLSRGDAAQQVADRLCVSRATVYNWAARFQDRAGLPPAERMADAARPGRPKSALAIAADGPA